MSSDVIKLNDQKEKFEDELDLKTIQDYEERLKNSETECISFDEIRKRLGL